MGTRTLEYIEPCACANPAGCDCPRPSKLTLVKLAAIGPGNAGKTTMLARIHTPDVYLEQREATVGVDTFFRNVWVQYGVERVPIRLVLRDCAGQERFEHLVPAFCRDMHGGFVVFDATSETSYRAALGWLKVLRTASADCVAVLVAAKYDLYTARAPDGSPLCAQWMEGRDMQQEAVERDCAFRFISSKTAYNVGAVALELAELAYAKALEDEAAVLERDAQQSVVDVARPAPAIAKSKNGCIV